MKVYRIANWDSIYETCETRKMAYLRWVPTPNKHDGLGYRRITAQKNRCELFSAWNLILQIASKGKRDLQNPENSERGRLIRSGFPLGADDLSIMTGFPAQIFEIAFVFFSSQQMGWLIVEGEDVTQPPERSGENPDLPGKNPVEEKEEKEVGAKGSHPTAQSGEETEEQFMARLAASPAYEGIDLQREFHKMLNWCNGNRKQPTRRRFISWLNRIDRPIGGLFQAKRKGPNI